MSRPHFALFRLETLAEHHPFGCFPHGMGDSILGLFEIPREAWQQPPPDVVKKTPQKKVWSLVGMCESPAELAQLVRQNPLAKYAVMTGELKPIKIKMPVFMEGHNLDQLEKEW